MLERKNKLKLFKKKFLDINFKIITFTVLINKKGKNMKPNRKEILENKLRTIVRQVLNENYVTIMGKKI